MNAHSANIVDRLREQFELHSLVGSAVVLAVSGGADSVAMLRGTCLLAEELRLSLFVMHVNHQLRGDDAEADAEWVRDLCDVLRVPCEIVAVDVAKRAAVRGLGVEETARDARYEVLMSVAERTEAAAVLLAHTADDQTETVLHHIVRGTGLAGLSGIPASRALSDRVRLVRPMLSVWRRDVEHFLQSLGQDFREDQSNRDTTMTRNVLRHELLPLLERRINPQVRWHLWQLAEQASEWREIIAAEAARLLRAALLDGSTTCVRLQAEAFREQPRLLVREAFVTLWTEREWPRQTMTFAHWESLAELAQADEPKPLQLPGRITCTRRGGLIALQKEHDARASGGT